MVNKSTITTLVAVLLIAGSLLISIPQDANAGGPMPPSDPGCCQFFFEGSFSCNNSDNGRCLIQIGADFLGFFEGQSCNQDGFCSGFEPDNLRNVPTLSEWGLIAMAGVLGIVGFMVIRRKRVTA